MSIHVALNHITHYRYDRRVGLSPQVVRLRPAPHCRTPILAYSLRIEPEPHFINWQQDPFANHLARLVFPDKTTAFKVTVDLIADMAVYPWTKGWEGQGQNIDDFPNVKRWQEAIAARPATVRAYARADGVRRREQPMDEEAKRILFGQTAAGVKPR